MRRKPKLIEIRVDPRIARSIIMCLRVAQVRMEKLDVEAAAFYQRAADDIERQVTRTLALGRMPQ